MGWWRPPCIRRVVIVNLKDDPNTALRGVLWSVKGAWFVLRNVQALQSNTQPAPVDGEVIIDRANVSFMQVLP